MAAKRAMPFTGTRATILRAGLVELPREVQLTNTTQTNITLHTEVSLELCPLDAEVVHLTFRTSCKIGTQAPALRQFYVVLP